MDRADSSRAPLGGEWFDVAVVGGGINGVAIARECARAGRRTLLLEQHDFGSGTTSRSTRIIHGGLRYLEHGDFGLVRESVRERERLLRERPHLVRPMQFVLALRPGATRNALALRAGLWLYRRMGHRGATAASEAARRLERMLDGGRRWAIFSYEDAQCEFPERLVLEWLADAVAAGAVARNHAEVVRIERSAGRVRGLGVRDAVTGEEFRIETECVVNATGPWADRVAMHSGIVGPEPMVGGVRGSHIVLAPFDGAPGAAAYVEAVDGRPIFLVPWNRQLLVGTTEVADSSDPGLTRPSEEEIHYLVRSVNRLFPRAQVTREQVIYAFAGVRPLPFAPGTAPAAVTRRHQLHDHAADGATGMISVIGGKLTTAASLARDCARAIGVEAAEAPEVVAGPAPEELDELTRRWSREVAQTGRLPKAAARDIVEWFGAGAGEIAELARQSETMRAPLCAHTQHVVAEAVYGIRHEFAVTLGDVLLRRVPVALGRCWSGECSRLAAMRIGRAAGWPASRIELEYERFEEERGRFLVKPASAETVVAA